MADAAGPGPSGAPGTPVLLWVDEQDKIVSFHPEAGFLVFSFPSREAMLDFAFERGVSGFRIQ